MIRLLFSVICLFGVCSSVSAQSLDIQLDGQDPRFMPVWVIHATCKQSVTLAIQSPEPLSQVSLLIGYDPQQIRVIWRERNQFMSSQAIIADKRMTYDLSSPLSSGKNILTDISLESLSWVTAVSFQIQTGSFVVTSKQVKKMLTPKTSNFNVSIVPECDPDITPPRIQLVYPESVWSRFSPDESLQFRITDDGKWIDRSRVSVEMWWFRYTQQTQGTTIRGDIISIKPRWWLWYNTWLIVRVSASDLQVYWWFNNSIEQYAMRTAVEPKQCLMMWCSIGTVNTSVVNSSLSASWSIIRRELSQDQCQLLSSHIVSVESISWFVREIGCDPSIMNRELISWRFYQDDSWMLLLFLWRWLFWCSVLLALLYRYDHRVLQKRQRAALFHT